MAVNLSGVVPANPSGPVSWLDTLFGESGGLGNAIGGVIKGLFDTIGSILQTGLELGGALLSGIVNGVTGLIDQVGKAIRGLLPSASPFGPIQDAFEDGQKELRDRIDLIPYGYCSAYMDKNVNLALGTNNLRKMPFRGQLGPNSGAHIDPAGHIVFDETGTWTVHTVLNARGTAFTGNNNIEMYVSVRRPDNSIFSEKYVMDSVDTNPGSLVISQPFVIPEPGYYVAVWAWSGRWRWWNGGTRYSGLTVIKADERTINPGSETVEDEEEG